ncbi:DUF1269 domain-containing protein [Aeromicrobium massiliense]|uniref:DUF1269 domain-containing protein n=1 Tax=Aeromicrobium massiliense TaxID=1464554 RepID=UPI0002DD28CD|nr:DUF1269 domain-containing protein [Aeromicrobium massiliense]
MSEGFPAGEELAALSASSLTVWHYDSVLGAAAGELRLRDLQQREAVTVVDAVSVTWVHGAHAPRIGHLRHRSSSGDRSVLAGLLALVVPDPAPADDPRDVLGTLARRLEGTGIERDFLQDIRSRLEPGTSALTVLATDADIDEVRGVVERGRARGDVRLMHAMLRTGAAERLAAAVHELQDRG